MDQRSVEKVFATLEMAYPDASWGPRADASPFEVLVLTILSAQTTDTSVDRVRPALFARFPTVESLASATLAEVESIVHPTGFYHTKARHIIAATGVLINRFGGAVPDRMEDLLTIPGVGRKTANIVLSHAFGRNEGVAIDTHAFRLARRIGFSDGTTPDKVEQDLIALFPREVWGQLTDLLIAHGRAICTARKPACNACLIREYCAFFLVTPS
jgi:endonuclease-3